MIIALTWVKKKNFKTGKLAPLSLVVRTFVRAFIIDVASGRIQTKADKNQQFDFIPWKRGVSL